MMKKKFGVDEEAFNSTYDFEGKAKETHIKEPKKKDLNGTGEYVDFTEIKDDK